MMIFIVFFLHRGLQKVPILYSPYLHETQKFSLLGSACKVLFECCIKFEKNLRYLVT